MPRTLLELDSMEASKTMLEEGLGIALLPRIAVAKELRDGTLVEIPLAGMPNPTRKIALITRRRPAARPRGAILRRDRPGDLPTTL